MPEKYTFVGEKEVYDYVKSIVKLDKRAEPNKIDEIVYYVDSIKKDYRDYGITIFDLILGELIHGS